MIPDFTFLRKLKQLFLAKEFIPYNNGDETFIRYFEPEKTSEYTMKISQFASKDKNKNLPFVR